jgi:hypothetical protein
MAQHQHQFQPNQPVLSAAEREQFLSRGFVLVRDCFSRAAAQQLTDQIWSRLGYNPNDPSTWQKPRVHMPARERFEIKTFAPKAWAVMCELCSGEDRIVQPAHWSDAFIVNFNDGADRAWVPPTPQAQGWHKDGDFFMHFLDSPEQALLTIVLWSDVAPRGGGTFLACDSVPQVARHLAQHTEGVHPYQFPTQSFVDPCTDFAEATGEIGDVYIMHPYMVHASSFNHSDVVRVITNPPIALKEPMRFRRANPADYSLVERAVLRGLGVDESVGLDFAITGPRARVVPERVRIQQKMREEEDARLKAMQDAPAPASGKGPA